MENNFASVVSVGDKPIGRGARTKLWVAVMASAMALTSGLAGAAETTFIGYTDGCFGLACVPPTTPTTATQSISLAGLTYNNSTFNVTTSAGFVSIGNAPNVAGNVDNLGSFTLSGAPFNYNGNDFDLRLTFTAPPGTTPTTVVITDVITGSVTATDVGGVFINFDNTPKHFTFAGGSFDLFVNDVSVTAGRSAAVTGSIIAVTTAVPEPESYAMMLSGLGLLGFIKRRRKQQA